MPESFMDRLPEELHLLIFQYLNRSPPSKLNARKEPTLELTDSEICPYKQISLVSKRWRRIILPQLFETCRLDLCYARGSRWENCRICGPNATEGQRAEHDHSPLRLGDSVHAAMFAKARAARHFPFSEDHGNVLATESLECAALWHHSLMAFVDFVQRHGLAAVVQSVTVLSDRTLTDQHDPYPHIMTSYGDYRFEAAAALFEHLLSQVRLSRLVVVAPPAELACLTNCAIHLHGDWAFADMEYHILELRMEPSDVWQTPSQVIGYQPSQYNPRTCPGIAGSSVLKVRPWTHLALNEGSFLRAYGTYEYFERGPPSIIHSIKDSFATPSRAGAALSHLGGSSNSSSSSSNVSISNHLPLPPPPPLPALRSFAYTAILPFATHLDFRGLLPHLAELDMQLAPEPDSGILDDKARVGKAELEDCWQEFFTAYRLITRPFHTFKLGAGGQPCARLARFVCRDVRLPALRAELDDEFTPLCLPVWAEREPGVFTRLAERAMVEGVGGEPFVSA